MQILEGLLHLQTILEEKQQLDLHSLKVSDDKISKVGEVFNIK